MCLVGVWWWWFDGLEGVDAVGGRCMSLRGLRCALLDPGGGVVIGGGRGRWMVVQDRRSVGIDDGPSASLCPSPVVAAVDGRCSLAPQRRATLATLLICLVSRCVARARRGHGRGQKKRAWLFSPRHTACFVYDPNTDQGKGISMLGRSSIHSCGIAVHLTMFCCRG